MLFRSDKNTIDNFLKDKEIDIIIHTAIHGGRRTKEEGFEIVYNNLLMWENLVNSAEKIGVKCIINIGSGAAFDRQRDIKIAKEEELNNNVPKDFYGFSKFLIEKDISNRKTNIRLINLRVFNIFSPEELSDRFIKGSINKCKNNEDLVIFKNIFFDFFKIGRAHV